MLLIIHSLSHFKGEANPLSYLQLKTKLLLLFNNHFFFKVCLLVSLQLNLLRFLVFQPSLFN